MGTDETIDVEFLKQEVSMLQMRLMQVESQIQNLEGEIQEQDDKWRNFDIRKYLVAGTRVTMEEDNNIIMIHAQTCPFGSAYAFGLEISGSTATIYRGYLVGATKRTHFASSETDVALTGTGTMYIYAYISKVNPTTLTVHNSSTASWPESNDDNYVFPLYAMTSSDGSNYNLDEPILGGRINR